MGDMILALFHWFLSLLGAENLPDLLHINPFFPRPHHTSIETKEKNNSLLGSGQKPQYYFSYNLEDTPFYFLA